MEGDELGLAFSLKMDFRLGIKVLLQFHLLQEQLFLLCKRMVGCVVCWEATLLVFYGQDL